MVVDTLDMLGNYVALNPLFSDVVEFLKTHDLDTMPKNKYEIKGKVTDRDTKAAIEGARIIVKPMQWKSDETFPPQAFDTLQTDKDGNYLYQNEMTVIDRFRVVCEDPSGALKADSATIKMDPQGGEGWYQGSDSQEVDFELKKQEP